MKIQLRDREIDPKGKPWDSATLSRKRSYVFMGSVFLLLAGIVAAGITAYKTIYAKEAPLVMSSSMLIQTLISRVEGQDSKQTMTMKSLLTKSSYRKNLCFNGARFNRRSREEAVFDAMVQS